MKQIEVITLMTPYKLHKMLVILWKLTMHISALMCPIFMYKVVTLYLKCMIKTPKYIISTLHAFVPFHGDHFRKLTMQ